MKTQDSTTAICSDTAENKLNATQASVSAATEHKLHSVSDAPRAAEQAGWELGGSATSNSTRWRPAESTPQQPIQGRTLHQEGVRSEELAGSGGTP